MLPWQLAAGLLQIDPLDPEVAVEVGAWIEEELKSELEAAELHHLRGVFLGQAAEAEAAVISLSAALMNEEQVRRQARLTFSNALTRVRESLDTHNRSLPVVRAQEWLGHLEWLRTRRNQLVHAHLRVGVAREHERGPLEPVVSYFHQIQNGQEVDWSLAPRSDREEGFPFEGDGVEIDSLTLKWDIWRAREATWSAARLTAALTS